MEFHGLLVGNRNEFLWHFLLELGSSLAIIWSQIDGPHWSNGQIHQINILFISLLIDLIIVGLLKIIVRRKRPEYNKDDQVSWCKLIRQMPF